MNLENLVDLNTYPLADDGFRARCKAELDKSGVLTLQNFLRPAAIEAIRHDGEAAKSGGYFQEQQHNVYLTPPDPAFAADHPRNRPVSSSKGCITDDQIPENSPLKTLYDADVFRRFLCVVLDETRLYDYADPLSSVNLHYADIGQELGWHFDNSSFAITLMIQQPGAGGVFEYVSALRDADAGEMNFAGVAGVLDGKTKSLQLAMGAGSLVLFRGRNALHRVAPVEELPGRMLAVLAYNSNPGISLSESARMTFYGRLA
jgi:hypothetical protein